MMNFDIEQIPQAQFEAWEERLKLVEQLLDEKLSIKEKKALKLDYMQKHGVGKRTIRNYILRYRKKGPKGLLFYRFRPRPLRIEDKALRQKINAMIDELPSRSVPQLRRLLNLDPDFKDKISSLSDRTIYRFLTENGMSFKERFSCMLNSSRRAYHRFESPHSLYLVQGDARDGIWLNSPDGKKQKTYLFLWIDDHSRKILYGKYYLSEKLPYMEDTFKHMVLRWGIPAKAYLDNGSVYISKHFAFILASLHISKIHHQAYCAFCKGKVEAQMKIILNQFQREAALCGFSSLEELNSAFWAWCDVYYNRKVHSSTGQTPDDRFLKGLKSGQMRITNLKAFNDLFLWRENRKITKYGNIKLHSNQYPVTKLPHGKVVTALFDPFDLGQVYIYDTDNNFVETTTWNKQVNNRVKGIPEEKQHSKQKISSDSRQYFANLREQHIKMQKQKQTDFSIFKNNNQELSQ